MVYISGSFWEGLKGFQGALEMICSKELIEVTMILRSRLLAGFALELMETPLKDRIYLGRQERARMPVPALRHADSIQLMNALAA
jgi:hypothetical protein